MPSTSLYSDDLTVRSPIPPSVPPTNPNHASPPKSVPPQPLSINKPMSVPPTNANPSSPPKTYPRRLPLPTNHPSPPPKAYPRRLHLPTYQLMPTECPRHQRDITFPRERPLSLNTNIHGHRSLSRPFLKQVALAFLHGTIMGRVIRFHPPIPKTPVARPLLVRSPSPEPEPEPAVPQPGGPRVPSWATRPGYRGQMPPRALDNEC
jgi:hypothetical protein